MTTRAVKHNCIVLEIELLTDAGAGQLIQQADLTPQKLARLLGSASRSALLKQAQAAREKQKTGAAQAVADACQELRQP